MFNLRLANFCRNYSRKRAYSDFTYRAMDRRKSLARWVTNLAARWKCWAQSERFEIFRFCWGMVVAALQRNRRSRMDQRRLNHRKGINFNKNSCSKLPVFRYFQKKTGQYYLRFVTNAQGWTHVYNFITIALLYQNYRFFGILPVFQKIIPVNFI